MAGKIYLIKDGGGLQAMSEQPYDAEDLLQSLLAQYPDLLAGEQMNAAFPRRWLLVKREMSVPGEEHGAGRWSLDHVFLDQDGIPTLVETKRSSDTRLRREVVGQLLDYAANAVVYWPVDRIRSDFEQTCRSAGNDPQSALDEFLDAGDDSPAGDSNPAEAFWSRVKTNLEAERVRLVFVADVIPEELRRVVEFLNGQMDPAEVLAVEIKQFVGEGLRSLVPRVIGQTAEARQKKSGGRSQFTVERDEAAFLAEMAAKNGPAAASIARQIVEWGKSHGLYVHWSDAAHGSVILIYEGRLRHQPFAVRLSGTIEVFFYWASRKPPFDDDAKLREWRRRLNEIPGVAIPEDALGGKPKFPLSLLEPEPSLQRFLDVCEWYLEQVREH